MPIANTEPRNEKTRIEAVVLRQPEVPTACSQLRQTLENFSMNILD